MSTGRNLVIYIHIYIGPHKVKTMLCLGWCVVHRMHLQIHTYNERINIFLTFYYVLTVNKCRKHIYYKKNIYYLFQLLCHCYLHSQN